MINPEPQMWLTMIQSVGWQSPAAFHHFLLRTLFKSWLRSDYIISHSNGVDFPWSLRMRMRGNSETGGSYTVPCWSPVCRLSAPTIFRVLVEAHQSWWSLAVQRVGSRHIRIPIFSLIWALVSPRPGVKMQLDVLISLERNILICFLAQHCIGNPCNQL